LKIVLAMCVMAGRTGAEWFVSDLALALTRKGHSVVLYAPIMGDMADTLRAQCIACVTDLACVADPPDVIIGHTRDETVACLAHFPGVPAISVCHDRTASHGQPPLFARVRQHVAVDRNCAERLSLQHGIPTEGIKIISNGVDLVRFRPRAPLPVQLRRAVIFSNYATDSRDTDEVRQACAATGIALDVIGSGVDRQASRPEDVLGNYDLVFAKARCAMEAMAVGCAVILLNEGMGYAGLVTSSNVAQWHPWNFGRRLMVAPIERDRIVADILRYDAADALAVSGYVRSHVSLTAMADAFDALARQVATDEARHTPVPPAVEMREFARHVTDNQQLFGTVPLAVQTGMLLDELAQARAALAASCSARVSVPEPAPTPDPHVGVLERQLSAMRASWSWRVTAPLRWLGAYFGF
jgi:hypothetical protein